MNIRTHHDDFTGTTYTVSPTVSMCISFDSVTINPTFVGLRREGISNVLLYGVAMDEFLKEWQRVTGQRVGLPVNAEDF